MQKSVLLRALQQEIRRHDFNYFVHEPPSIAQGGRGVVVPGCPACMNETSFFLGNLSAESPATEQALTGAMLAGFLARRVRVASTATVTAIGFKDCVEHRADDSLPSTKGILNPAHVGSECQQLS